MMRHCLPGFVAGLLVLAFAATAQAAGKPLTVCLEEDSPPYSFKFRSRQGGFDLAVAGHLAEALGRPLKVQWFESENDDENVQTWEANALLSDGLCDLIGGYPLFAAGLGTPTEPRGAIPEYDGMKRSERGRMVDLGVVIASIPYHRAGFAVIRGAGAEGRAVRSLVDLMGLRIGAEVSTLSSALLFRFRGGLLVEDIAHVAPSKGLLRQLEDGRFDVALTELHRFDQYRKRNPDTALEFSGYVHPLGFNFGFAALEREAPLIARVDTVLQAAAKDGTLERLAREAGMTFLAPRAPAVLEAITPSMLAGG